MRARPADYAVRVLQSRGMLRLLVPMKDPQSGGITTREVTVVARAAFIEATTRASVDHENATRCFELQMDESEPQTRRIHERQRLMKTEAGHELRREADELVKLHWTAQRLLEPTSVVIPFAAQLTFPSAWMRTRRDHARFLNLIEVSAFLHQHQRDRRNGAVVATVDDYAVAYRLAAHVLAETLADLKPPLRDAYERMRPLFKEGEAIARREIREALAVPDGTLRHWLDELVELEYVESEGSSRGGAGRVVRYRLSDRAPRPALTTGLLTPAELAGRLAR